MASRSPDRNRTDSSPGPQTPLTYAPGRSCPRPADIPGPVTTATPSPALSRRRLSACLLTRFPSTYVCRCLIAARSTSLTGLAAGLLQLAMQFLAFPLLLSGRPQGNCPRLLSRKGLLHAWIRAAFLRATGLLPHGSGSSGRQARLGAAAMASPSTCERAESAASAAATRAPPVQVLWLRAGQEAP